MPVMDLDRDQWQQLKAVLTTALKLPLSERVAMLEQALKNDPALKDCAVEMLQYYDTATRQFDTIGGTTTTAAMDDIPDNRPRPRLAVGDSFGHYRLLRKLGEGGMGVVYLAQDERLGRQVALKFLSGGMHGAFADSKAQLLAESRSAAILNHPAIVTLHDVLDIGDELVTVMEFVEGRPLTDVIRGQPLPLGYALRLTCQLADALSYAHGRGIAHCDLKPANIHVLPGGSPKILDFGLAKVLASTSGAMGGPNHGPIFGTPGYLAPEQLLGREATAAADVYALGVILYQMLTGGPPFQFGDNSQLLFDTITEAPLPPSQIVPAIPAAVDDVALRCLAKNPRQRLQPHEITRALSNALLQLDTTPLYDAGGSTTATPRSSGEVSLPALDAIQDVARWQRRVGAAVAGVALTMLWFTVAGLVASVSYNQPLGRAGAFADESPLLWPVWGMRAMFAPVGWSVILAVGLLAATSVLRALAMAIPPFRRMYQGAVERAGRVGAPGSVLSFVNVASLLLVAQVAVVGGIWWYFREVMNGLDSFVTADYAALQALSPAHGDLHGLLGKATATEAFVFALGWIVLWRAALAASDRTPRRHVWAGAMLTIGSLVLFQAFPFRILYHNEEERVSYQSERCYRTGQRGDDILLFCPHRAAPWTQVVKQNDPALHVEGTVESIFSGFDRP